MITDRSGELGPARDQGNRGTCLAFATTAAHALARAHSRSIPAPRFSEEALYHLAKAIDANSTAGTHPASIGQALATTGQPDDARWPYDGGITDLDPLPAPPAAWLDPPGPYRASLHPIDTALDTLATALQSGVGVLVGVELWPGFYAPAGNTLSVPAPTDFIGEGHAIVLGGADEAQRRLLLRNSWGLGWGLAGAAWIEEIAWRRAGLGAWVIRDDIDA